MHKTSNPILLLMIGFLTVILAVLVIFAVQVNREPPQLNTDILPQTSSTTVAEPEQTEPPQPTTQTTAPTEPTEPPAPPDPMEEAALAITAFAEQHGYGLEDYPEKIIELYAKHPEAREYVLNFPLEYGKDHEIDISGYADFEGVPLFIQWDKQWGYLDFAGNVAGLAACGPTCMSMIMYHFTRDPQYTPAYMMKFAMDNRYALSGSGTQWSFFKEGAKKLGLNVKELNSDQMANEKYIAQVLESGKLLVMNVRPGVFTEVGHYLMIVGYEDGKFQVNDPNSRIRSEKLWEFEEFADQIKIMWAFDM